MVNSDVVTGLVFGNVSRLCRRRLFFGSLLAVVGFVLTSRIDAALLRVLILFFGKPSAFFLIVLFYSNLIVNK